MADITGSITKIRTSDNNEHFINAKYWDGHEWGELASAFKYCGITTTKLTDGDTTNPVVIDGVDHTATAGCVVFYEEDTEDSESITKEFVFNGTKWELLGGDLTYKVIQSPVSSPSETGSAMAFIDTISQDANGVITVTKKYYKEPYKIEYAATESLGNLSPCNINSVLHEYDTSTGKGVFIYDESPTSIGNDAFRECSSLTSVTIPDSVTAIGSYAFYYCRNLTSVTIGNSVNEIGSYAFRECHNLTSVTIPDSVTTIGEGAFGNCRNLTSVTIPDSVTSIGNSAFALCRNLTSVTIPDSVTTIGIEAFRDCNGELIINSKIIETDYTSDTCPIYTWLKNAEFKKLIIGDSITTIGVCAFNGCNSLTSVTIGDSVTTIGNQAFDSCSSLTSVTIPDSVTTIGDSAFRSCGGLTSVTIPNSVTTIGNEAFYGCNGELIFNNKIIEINYTHETCPSNSWLKNAEFTKLTIGDSVTKIGEGAFDNCSSLTSVTIPDSVTTIGDYAFIYCLSLTSVTIPDSVTTIGNEAFFYCSRLTSVNIPDSVTTIGNEAFYNCSSLTSVTISDIVTTIGDGAFKGCSNLTSVIIGDSVTTIGNQAFNSCSSLTSVYCKSTTPPSLGGASIFGNNDKGRNIYVPSGSVNMYKTATNWSEYVNSIVGCIFKDEPIVVLSDDDIFLLVGKDLNGNIIPKNKDISSLGDEENMWGSVYTKSLCGVVGTTTIDGDVHANAFYETSDENLKDFSDDITVDFNKLKEIRKSYFTWKDDEEGTLQIGTSAQDIQKVYPELVSEDNSGHLTVDYARLSLVALSAIDKLDERISKIENALNINIS